MLKVVHYKDHSTWCHIGLLENDFILQQLLLKAESEAPKWHILFDYINQLHETSSDIVEVK